MPAVRYMLDTNVVSDLVRGRPEYGFLRVKSVACRHEGLAASEAGEGSNTTARDPGPLSPVPRAGSRRR